MKLILLCMTSTENFWRIVENPDWNSPTQEGAAAQLMQNIYNSYVEYENCGLKSRVIRQEDLDKYIAPEDQ